MTEGEKTRLVAWGIEMRRVHERLREALHVAREGVVGDAPLHATHDLLLFCHGFCDALTVHHQSEDGVLFPAIAAAHPALEATLLKLQQDHAMISQLLDGVREAVDGAASPADLDRRLQGIAAIMESHFRYEERRLLGVLEDLDLGDDPRIVLGVR